MDKAKDPLDRYFGHGAPKITLRGGEALARIGQPLSGLYRLQAGRIGELKPTSNGASQVLAVHRPGALLGGSEALGDGKHHSDLVALRDSELLALPIRKAEGLLRRDPHLLAAVARAALKRLEGEATPARHRSAIIGFTAVCDSVAMRDFTENLATRTRKLGSKTVVLGAEAAHLGPSEISRLEADNDLVLMAVERGQTTFSDYCSRQIDRLVLVGSPLTPPRPGLIPVAAAAIAAHRLMDVILVQPPTQVRPGGSDVWLTAAPASRLFHVRAGDDSDLDRLARIYAGKSVGVVLSGGGARAYAHIGVVRALRELRVPIDFTAGNSMGAIIAAGVAMGWDDTELELRLKDAFVTSSPLNDIAFPILAMTRGREVERRLERHFADAQICDLWRPFACVSTDLTTGRPHHHRRGLVREALRASLSLPGVLPPVVKNGHVLVDGAMVDNLPVGLVKGEHDGWTLGADVGHAEGLGPEDLKLQPSGWAWLASGAWRRGPPIVAVLIRAATVGTEAATAADRNALDLTFLPHVDDVGLQDWKAYAPAVSAGYRATLARADDLAEMAAPDAAAQPPWL
jgi:NTE family protein